MKPLIIGVGNEIRRDDSIGVLAVSDLARSDWAQTADFLICRGTLIQHIHLMKRRPVLVVVDAVNCGERAGTVIRMVRRGREFSLGCPDGVGSHALNLDLCLSVLAINGDIPDWIILYGVQPEDMGFGTGLSECAQWARYRLVQQITADQPWRDPSVLTDAIWVGGQSGSFHLGEERGSARIRVDQGDSRTH